MAHLLGQRLVDRLAAHHLHPVHLGVLAHLDAAEQLSQVDLARAVLQRPQSIAALLDGLERRGPVRRMGARVRGRRHPVQITDDGRAALQAAWSIAVSSNDLSDAGLTPAESAELNRLLLKVLATSDSTLSDDPGLGLARRASAPGAAVRPTAPSGWARDAPCTGTAHAVWAPSVAGSAGALVHSGRCVHRRAVVGQPGGRRARRSRRDAGADGRVRALDELVGDNVSAARD